jgi:HEAT repeat protein
MARPVTRLVGLWFAFILLAANGGGRPSDPDPEVNGKKASAWVEVLQSDTSARKRALAVGALAKAWNDKRFPDALPAIGRAVRVDASTAVRAAAAGAIGQLKAEDAKAVAGDLADAAKAEKDSRVRKELASALGQHPVIARTVIIPLTNYLNDPEAGTKATAADALGRAGVFAKSAAPELLALLADPDKAARQAAVYALGRVGPDEPEKVGAALAKVLATEKEADLKRELLGSIGLLGPPAAETVAAVAYVLTNPDAELRRQSVRVLTGFGPAGKPAADALLKVVANPKEDKAARAEAVRAFGAVLAPELKARAKDLLPLLDPAKEPEFEVRFAVVEELGAAGPSMKDQKDVLAALRSRQSDPQVRVRQAATAALKRVESPPAKKP